MVSWRRACTLLRARVCACCVVEVNPETWPPGNSNVNSLEVGSTLGAETGLAFSTPRDAGYHHLSLGGACDLHELGLGKPTASTERDTQHGEQQGEEEQQENQECRVQISGKRMLYFRNK
ncbi:hypothetical protein HPP92_009699 [Vanilla planifolia]|uniref:Secreted protein n=1 Tax=Vanilla planifolia TaxID=51239 RepID=A0A835V6K0_VANPL|nr:hypothetical protein HPP92_009699 [Vanilla planifolia]